MQFMSGWETSNLRVTKTTVRNGTLYVYGREEKFQYVPHTTH